MSESIQHECGIALIRLLRPITWYREKYGTWQYGLNKLYLLMEKQHNRGQDGAGMVSVKIELQPGQEYITRFRSNDQNPIREIFGKVEKARRKAMKEAPREITPQWIYDHLPFSGELFLGHLRYGTFGRNSIEFVHPVMRQNNWKSRNLVLAGNFNLTNTDELFRKLIDLGQHPKAYTDTVTILEKLGHFLDEENQLLFRQYKNEGHTNQEISPLIEQNLDLRNLLERSSKDWDGGYTVAGLVGHGDAFVMRDPWGIRPAFYYHDDEIVVAASERPVIQTVMDVHFNQVREIAPGNALLIRKDGRVSEEMVRIPKKRASCSFERIYFSRGSDTDIYRERKELGRLLAPAILEMTGYDFENTVFSYIPNTSETAFYGMTQGIRDYLNDWKIREIRSRNGSLTDEQIREILAAEPRIEKIAVKDVKLRTFIADEGSRHDLVAHVYDITYGVIRDHKDTLVIIDDSIVRGTTLRDSIIKILDRLHPLKILIVSSAPQIRFPDCYGIDMTRIDSFIAFNAAISLLQERGMEQIIEEVYKKCKEQENLPREEVVNYVGEIYKPFTDQEISDRIAMMVSPEGCGAEVKILYQTVENLHKACPNDTGDWYFTGNYPTPGGNKVVNASFINFIENRKGRSY
ncbi:MAG: amidophosphoribosyltransferase [Prolixibacteraceae bacterium]|jgi:amidophosphoribosyltransferase|nr:amidophosphoribosyltransferase [Prolixibacteraceae bacterium]NLX29364.1 amidophosphoribosyltransferase [Bacteroidales bacterium]HNQ38154.1 amidophosphoribosyltransferase [Prolixibacteraceae bacterium]HOY50215.1 amidophosphoribosyltransferase [Prolixibacteraceae bacterium]HRV88653.1 amidophosphoribosyltransferase [Prolixibacteraceae bacterium]